MDIHTLLSGRNDCPCHRTHSCDVRYVEIGDRVLSKLPQICKDFSRIHLIADSNTEPLCGAEVRARLKNKCVSQTIFGKEIVVPNERAIQTIEDGMSNDIDFIVGIGSGVINDLCKHVAFLRGIRYAIIATAPSMDGYASIGAALILNGMKVTLNARVPYAILAESEILATAPIEMLQSGYGDIVGKYSCLNDWQLAHFLRSEYFCDKVYQTVSDVIKRVENTAKAILSRDKEAIRNLMEGLVTVGIMMSYVGNSRPASGSEHHLSHFFEITGILDGTPYYPHGIDVLYSAVLTASLRKKLLSFTPPFSPQKNNRNTWERDLRKIYSSAADGVIALQDRIGLYAETDIDQLSTRWDGIREILKDASDVDRMLCYVKGIGLDMQTFQDFYGIEKLRNAVRYAKDLKDRYTVLWLAYVLGIDVPLSLERKTS